MRGIPDPQMAMLTTVSAEDLIPVDHAIRRTRVHRETLRQHHVAGLNTT